MTPSPDAFPEFRGRRVLVIGDVILDRYVFGEVPRISPEAPVPVLNVCTEELRGGGAANVAANLASLGARPHLVAVVGRDTAGKTLRARIRQSGVPVAGVRVDPGRRTVEKTRMLARHQQVLRVDQESPRPLGEALERQVCEHVRALLPRYPTVVLSDYAKGVVTPAVIAAACGGPGEVLVDPKGRDYRRYRGAHVITPNAAEAEAATGIETATEDGCREAARALLRAGRFQAVVITRGAEGIYFRTRRGAEGRAPARARGVFDVTGAGDTVLAVLALARAAGLGLERAVELANAAAGLVVERLGASVVTPAELGRALLGTGSTLSRIMSLAGAAELAAQSRVRGQKVVLTNGCFDLLHAGHIETLEFARSQGDVLMVALNDDASVRRLKGPGRPLQDERARLRVMAGLACVDAVFLFSEDTPLRVVQAITPDVLVKGSDWKDRGVVGREWVERHGGRVVLAPTVQGFSTSRIVTRMQGAVDGRASRGRSR